MLDTAILGRIIRDERKELNLRQDQLAAASGVGLRFIIELERGKPTVQLGKVLTVLAALGCSVQVRRPRRSRARWRCPAAASCVDVLITSDVLGTLAAWWNTKITDVLSIDRAGAMHFHYAPAWLADPQAPALSQSMPKHVEPYDDRICKTVFVGLLPEETQRTKQPPAQEGPCKTLH
jgi:HTH-type transcriptional regulator / antitoxin HipB